MVFKAVLFDFGGVITTSPFDAFSAYENEIKAPQGFIRKINSTNPDSNAWAKFERNDISKKEFKRLFEIEASHFGQSIDADRVLKCLETTIRPKMVQLVKDLSSHYIVGILTNNLQENTDKNNDKKAGPTGHISSVSSYVDGIFESSKLGVRKPEPKFYKIACNILNVEPTDCVFLDDLGINLKPAKKMGMTTIKVVNEEQALRDIRFVLNETTRSQ
ncbi:MAG: HAD family hydrolase [Acidimicrobiaceae bacterium]|nr:HAD family hydrolase [Acidimicrobiaceae bacterium]